MNTTQPVTETELVAKATAPRVTEKDLEATIKQVTYIRHGVLTLCILELQNGFIVTGESACASPENYDQDIGERIALENAKERIWPLMGYALRDRLWRDSEDAVAFHQAAG